MIAIGLSATSECSWQMRFTICALQRNATYAVLPAAENRWARRSFAALMMLWPLSVVIANTLFPDHISHVREILPGALCSLASVT